MFFSSFSASTDSFGITFFSFSFSFFVLFSCNFGKVETFKQKEFLIKEYLKYNDSTSVACIIFRFINNIIEEIYIFSMLKKPVSICVPTGVTFSGAVSFFFALDSFIFGCKKRDE